MFNPNIKRRAKYFLELREQGGHRLLHFVRINKWRFILFIGFLGGYIVYCAFMAQWFCFWVLLSILLSGLLTDLSWFLGMRRSWPFLSRVTNWDEVRKISDGDPSAYQADEPNADTTPRRLS